MSQVLNIFEMKNVGYDTWWLLVNNELVLSKFNSVCEMLFIPHHTNDGRKMWQAFSK